MKTAEIRDSFLQYFADKGHAIVQSSALVPFGDPTLLFTNAGMVQFKDCFLGTESRPYNRATTCQKCLRISGKHNDLENVGRTARHHTFFEMLGNFSFGDYFKEQAIAYAWEFLTVNLQLPKERLWVTVYEEDDEAAELWARGTDVLPGRILRLGKEDNFWAMGETGPCGPCSEIHYYLGDNVAGQSEQEFRAGTGAYLEIWNLVFMQFNRDTSGTLTPLPKPSVDTGMGLERIAAVKQGVAANYDTDALRRLIAKTEELSGKHYLGRDYTERDPEKDEQYGIDVAMRVVADHLRAAAFLIADGVNPGSDGRGYVLRRLIRRACRHGRVLGFNSAVLFKVAEEVVDVYGDAYPELQSGAQKIINVLRAEEEKFIETLDTGIALLRREVDAVKQSSSRVLPGSVAFLLHDTYGFPLDMTEDMVRSQGLSVDTEGFAASMEEQRERSRSARASETAQILQRSVKPTASRFVGYEYDEYESRVLGVFAAEGERKGAKEGDQIALVVAETPFYAESGGQVGDTGAISSNSASLDVIDTQKAGGDTIVHICRVVEGEIGAGEGVRLSIDAERRRKLRINHSATHLVHLALREVLGDHVKQAGSRVSDSNLRFDFSHFDALAPAQLEEIEAIVNHEVQENHPVITQVLPLEEAKNSGAMALFGEKYGEFVRVVQIGPRSKELCGGTHVQRAGDIGFVSLLSEGGVAAGVRRVEAVGGPGALSYMLGLKRKIREAGTLLKVGEREIEERIAKLLERNRELERKMERFAQAATLRKGDELTQRAEQLGDGTKIVVSRVEDATPKQLREMADDLRARIGSGCIALGSVQDGKAIMLTAVTKDLTERFHAGKLLEQLAPIMGSRGGGRADLAQAGGGDPSKLESALARFKELVS